MKKYFNTSLSLLCFVIFISGCSSTSSHLPTISFNEDSEYLKTFSDLNLGILFDFHMTLPNADQNWVNLWVERYDEGTKEDHPIAQLSYGDSPNNLEEGRLGFGLNNIFGYDKMTDGLYKHKLGL